MKVAIALLTLLFALSVHSSFAQNDVEADAQKLEKFIKSIDQRYVDSVNTSSIVERGIRDMLEELDPHSVYMTADQYTSANEPLTGKYKGIGIRYRVIDDTLTVVDVIEESPAQKGGLNFGDQIISIGTDTLAGKGLTASKMSKFIKAEYNTTEPFAILREDQQKEIVLDRDNVPVSSIATTLMLDKETGYVKLTRFSSTSVSDFKSALDKLKAQGMSKLIFDLRGNSGGYLNAAIKIADEFLEDRKLIVYTEGIHQNRKETLANSGGRFTDGDLVVLIDERSASASEIVAGAIQDWDRGLLVGRRSYGKGLVQRTIEYDDGSAMRLTISRYYTPTGRSIQKPYDDGLKAYKSDLNKRKLSGELLSKDSIKVNDSLVYLTPAKRKVYGGGGIIPDRFIPADTSALSKELRKLYSVGLHYYLAIEMAQKGKDQILALYPEVEEFTEAFQISEEDMTRLQSIAVSRDLSFDDAALAKSKSRIAHDVKDILARYVYGYESQFYTLSQSDEAIQMAIQWLNDDTLNDLGLNAE